MAQNNKCNESVEKCFTNIDLVTNICKYLNYKDECQMQQVSRELNDIIINFVWKKQFKEVKIFKSGNDFIVKYMNNSSIGEQYKNIQTTKQIFDKREMENFFNLNTYNIKKLVLISVSLYYYKVRFPIEQKFTNLTHIEFDYIIVTYKDIEMLANNCKELESLMLMSCFNKNYKNLLIGKDIDIEIIKSMQKLKILYIGSDRSGKGRGNTFTDVIKILSELELQDIALNFQIYPDPEPYNYKNEFDLSNFKSYKILDIGPFQKCNDFTNFQRYFLPKFINLSELCLDSDDENTSITEELFNNLLKFCRNLTNLSLFSCKINAIIAMPKLQKLRIDFCSGLTFEMLKIILSDMQLESFSSQSSHYEGNFQKFVISSSLKELELSDLNTNILELLDYNYKNLKQLTKFTWKTYGLANYKINFLNDLSQCMTLNIKHKHIHINDCMQLKHLKKLDIIYGEILHFSDVLLLLRHENLQELSINSFEKSVLNVELSEIVAFQTKLHHLDIDWNIMNVIPDFFFDLLELNWKLSLTCNRIDSFDFIMELMRTVKLPQRNKYVYIGGFKIDLPNDINYLKILKRKFLKYQSTFDLLLE